MSRLHRAMLGTAALLVPRLEREEWLAEWLGEVWTLEHAGGPCGVTRFCLGAFRDAAWMWTHRTSPRRAFLRSPVRCLALLAVAAGCAGLAAFGTPAVMARIQFASLSLHALMLLLSMAILPVAADLAIPAQGVRGWLFLVAKTGLAVATAFFGAYDLAPLIGPVQPHATMVGYVLAVRWALNDQRRRCPECLRLCGAPVRLGQPSNVLLDWYGTELMCPEGHGLLQAPALAGASYAKHRWQPLDAAWRGLFS